MKKFIHSLLALTGVALATATGASATPGIIKVPLNESSGSDVYFDGSFFGTIADANGASMGDQDTIVDFIGPLSGVIPDLFGPIGSFSLDSVAVVGPAQSIGGVIVQGTQGGVFSLYDPANSLLLSGVLSDGALTGSAATTSGSFFNTSIASFTGGSLMPLLVPSSAGLSISLAGISSIYNGVAQSGLRLFSTNNGSILQPFTADASGVIEGQPIPEPLTLGLLIPGLLAGARLRRKQALV